MSSGVASPGRARGFVRWAAFAVTLGAVAACAVRAEVTRVDARTYRVDCKDALAACLVPVQEICRANGYDVVQGTEQRSHVGSALPEGYETVTAKATVRCREAVPLFGADPNRPPSAAASAAPPPRAAVVAAPPAPPAPSVAPPPPAPNEPPPPAGPALDGGAP